jgi:hypothetical protein
MGMKFATILNYVTSESCDSLACSLLERQREQQRLDAETTTILETFGIAIAYGLGIGIGVVIIALPIIMVVKLVRNRR